MKEGLFTKKTKRIIFNILQPGRQENKYEIFFDMFFVLIILLNIITSIADTFQLPPAVKTVSNYFETFSIIVFSAEYILRLWTATNLYPNKSTPRAYIKYVFSFMAIIDLLAILPFYLPYIFKIDLRILKTLRLLRLFRLLKMHRYTNSLTLIIRVFRHKAAQLFSSLFVIGSLLIISSLLMYSIESPVQPDVFSNAFSGLWWAISTFTTVGYGDIYPITVAGKVLSAIISLLGIALVAVSHRYYFSRFY